LSQAGSAGADEFLIIKRSLRQKTETLEDSAIAKLFRVPEQ